VVEGGIADAEDVEAEVGVTDGVAGVVPAAVAVAGGVAGVAGGEDIAGVGGDAGGAGVAVVGTWTGVGVSGLSLMGGFSVERG
jgi:hypothetical protein